MRIYHKRYIRIYYKPQIPKMQPGVNEAHLKQ